MRFVLPFAFASLTIALVSCAEDPSQTESAANASSTTSDVLGHGWEGGQGNQGQAGQPGRGKGRPSTSALPLGKVQDLGALDCATVPNSSSLPAGNATCRTLSIDCPGTETIEATVAVIEPESEAIGTIVLHGGGGGAAFFGRRAFVSQYLAEGYRVVDMQWASDWEQTSTETPSIKTAACRPSTVIRWAFEKVHGRKRNAAFCGQGQSGGSGVMSYALAAYGLDNILDYVMLTQGPPFGKMDCGCDPNADGCSPPPLCPEIPAPVTQLPQKVADWAGVSSCGRGGLTPAELSKLDADSVASADGDFDYPKTKVSGWFCAQRPNGTTGGGAFYLDKVTTAGGSKPSVFCSPNCEVESIYGANARLSDATLVTAAMLQEMKTECVPRHRADQD